MRKSLQSPGCASGIIMLNWLHFLHFGSKTIMDKETSGMDELEKAKLYFTILASINEINEDDYVTYLQMVGEIISKITGFRDSFWIGKLSEGHLEPIVFSGKRSALLNKFYTGELWKKASIGLTAIRLRDFAYTDHYSRDKNLDSRVSEDFEVESAGAFPIIRNDEVWGIVSIASPKIGIFPPDVIDIVKRISSLINKKFYEIDLKRSEQEAFRKLSVLNLYYRTLADINALMIKENERASLFQKTCELIVSGIREATMAWVGIWSKDQMHSVALQTNNEEVRREFYQLIKDYPFSEKNHAIYHTLVMDSFTKNSVIVVNDYANSKYVENKPYLEFLRRVNSNAVIVLPLNDGKKKVGVICLYASTNSFVDDIVDLLKTLVNNISNKIHLISLEEKNAKSRKIIEHQAFHDKLTDLPNRAYFSRIIDSSISNANRYNGSLALFELDLDGFKSINDIFGHVIGDKILIKVAKRLKSSLKTENAIFRMGGDEFTIVLGSFKSDSELEMLANKIIKKINKPMIIGHQKMSVGISIGIAIKKSDKIELGDFFNIADRALYKSKSAGRNQYRLCAC